MTCSQRYMHSHTFIPTPLGFFEKRQSMNGLSKEQTAAALAATQRSRTNSAAADVDMSIVALAPDVLPADDGEEDGDATMDITAEVAATNSAEEEPARPRSQLGAPPSAPPPAPPPPPPALPAVPVPAVQQEERAASAATARAMPRYMRGTAASAERARRKNWTDRKAGRRPRSASRARKKLAAMGPTMGTRTRSLLSRVPHQKKKTTEQLQRQGPRHKKRKSPTQDGAAGSKKARIHTYTQHGDFAKATAASKARREAAEGKKAAGAQRRQAARAARLAASLHRPGPVRVRPFALSTARRAAAKQLQEAAAAPPASPFRSLANRARDFEQKPRRFYSKPAAAGPDLPAAPANAAPTEACAPAFVSDARAGRRPTDYKGKEHEDAAYTSAHCGAFRARGLDARVMHSSGSHGVPKVRPRPVTKVDTFTFATTSRLGAAPATKAAAALAAAAPAPGKDGAAPHRRASTDALTQPKPPALRTAVRSLLAHGGGARGTPLSTDEQALQAARAAAIKPGWARPAPASNRGGPDFAPTLVRNVTAVHAFNMPGAAIHERAIARRKGDAAAAAKAARRQSIPKASAA